MELGEHQLKVQRASIGSTQAAGMGAMGVNAMSMLAGTTSGDLEQGRVIQLLNMVTTEELMNDEDYAGKSKSKRFACWFDDKKPINLTRISQKFAKM